MSLMKTTLIIYCLVFVSINLYAQVNWIPIDSVKKNENTKPVNKLFENLKIIQHLIDNKNDKKEVQLENKKKWYTIKNIQNN